MSSHVRFFARWLRAEARTLAVGVIVVTAIIAAGFYSDSGLFASNAFPVVVGGLALCLSGYQYYRAEIRTADARVLLVNRPTVTSAEPSDPAWGRVARVLLTHPIVIENIGARPCVVTDIEVVGQLPRENWYRIEANIDGPMHEQVASAPVVLNPRDPHVLRLSYYLTAAQRQPNGWSNDLPKVLPPLGTRRPVVSVMVVYTSGSETRRSVVDFALDARGWRSGVQEAAEASPGPDVSPGLQGFSGSA